MPKPFTYSSMGPLNLHPVLRWCLRLVLFAVGLVLAASALAASMLLLAFVSARALCLAVAGRGGAAVRGAHANRGAFRHGARMAARTDVVDVEARSLS
jgi:hypothetical protein